MKGLPRIVVAVFLMLLGTGSQAAGVRTDMLVSTEWLARHLDDPEVVVLHVASERAHYEAGHIPGARFVDLKKITATVGGTPNELAPVEQLVKVFRQAGAGGAARLVLYGDAEGLSAARGYFTLDYLGHGGRAAVLDGGLEKWKAEGRAVSKDNGASGAAEFAARAGSGVVAGLPEARLASWLVKNTGRAGAALVDARPPEQYSGETPGDGIPRGGHIPGAVNVFWKSHLKDGPLPVLRPVDELQDLYRQAGLGDDDMVIAYCRTGGQAAHAYFTLKYLGYNVLLYDGSFHEWSNTEGTDVEAGPQG